MLNWLPNFQFAETFFSSRSSAVFNSTTPESKQQSGMSANVITSSEHSKPIVPTLILKNAYEAIFKSYDGVLKKHVPECLQCWALYCYLKTIDSDINDLLQNVDQMVSETPDNLPWFVFDRKKKDVAISLTKVEELKSMIRIFHSDMPSSNIDGVGLRLTVDQFNDLAAKYHAVFQCMVNSLPFL